MLDYVNDSGFALSLVVAAALNAMLCNAILCAGLLFGAWIARPLGTSETLRQLRNLFRKDV